MSASGNFLPVFNDFTVKTNTPKKENNSPSKPKQEISKGKDIASSLAASAVSISAVFLANPVAKFILKFMKTDSQLGIKLDDVLKEINLMADKHKLTEKGFSGYIFSREIPPEFTTESEKNNYIANRTLVENSGGCVYLTGSNKNFNNYAWVVEEKASGILHETGHAVQFNNSKIGRLLHKLTICRQINVMGNKIPLFALIPSFILSLAVGHKDKEPENKIEKTTNNIFGFIKNHAGAITFATFLPILLDEGFATKHALDHLKSTGSKMLAPLRKNYGIAYLTYLSLAAFGVLGVKGGLAVKDKIIGYKPQTAEKQS